MKAMMVERGVLSSWQMTDLYDSAYFSFIISSCFYKIFSLSMTLSVMSRIWTRIARFPLNILSLSFMLTKFKFISAVSLRDYEKSI